MDGFTALANPVASRMNVSIDVAAFSKDRRHRAVLCCCCKVTLELYMGPHTIMTVLPSWPYRKVAAGMNEVWIHLEAEWLGIASQNRASEAEGAHLPCT
jgi:hypothetical protein